MSHFIPTLFAVVSVSIASPVILTAQRNIPTANDSHTTTEVADRTILFDINAEGQSMPVNWGLDTAWPSRENMIRGIRYIGASNLSVARASFQPWAIVEDGNLPINLKQNLNERIDIIKLIGHPVGIVLNSDPGDGSKVPDYYKGNPKAWADLIDATALEVVKSGYDVITASPFNC